MPTPTHSRLERLNIAFREKPIWDMTPEERAEFVATLCNEEIPNPNVQHRAIVRMLAIDHVQMAGIIRELEATITRLNQENGKIAKRVLVLTWICAICGGIQAFGVFWMICQGH